MKLNQPLGANSGGLMYSDGTEWKYICADYAFAKKEAKVACKGLLQDYVDGLPLRGEYFGELNVSPSNVQFTCSGELIFLLLFELCDLYL